MHGPLERASAAHLEAAIREELTGTFFTMNLDRARSAFIAGPLGTHRRAAPAVAAAARGDDRGARAARALERRRARQCARGSVRRRLQRRAAAIRRPRRKRRAGGRALSRMERDARAARAHAGSASGSRRAAAGVSPRAARGGPLAIELGREDPTARLEHFATAYGRTIDALARAGTRIEHVDLRYRNGFAARVPGFQERAPKKTGTADAQAQKGMG